ncbi:MAG: malonyl-[acyl-carrier protein] O-methyltransferase BioC, partial [Thiohalomonadales bacterium]
KVETLMRELKALGAHNAHSHQSQGLTGRSSLAKMKKAYEQYRQQGKLPATYEVVFGHAWKGTDTANQINVSLS